MDLDLSSTDNPFIRPDRESVWKEAEEAEAATATVQAVYTVLKTLGLIPHEQLDDEREKLWKEWRFNAFDVVLKSRDIKDNEYVWDWAGSVNYPGKYDKILVTKADRILFAKKTGKKKRLFTGRQISTEAALVTPEMPSRNYRPSGAKNLQIEHKLTVSLPPRNPRDPSLDDATLYNRLPNNDWFRVLFIMPGDFASPVVCWLRTFRREDAIGQYEALSYSWTERSNGIVKESASRNIKCNGGEVPINQSLEMALRHLRSPVSHRAMWIDRLCIHQDNPEERSQQVQVMSHIYSQALRTIVWLGMHGESDIIKGFSAICKTVNAWDESQTAAFYKVDLDTGGTTTCHIAPEEGLDTGMENHYSPLPSLFRRPWFERRWVIQEVVHSRDIEVMARNYIIPWDWIGLAAAILRTDHNTHLSGIANAYLMFRLRKSDAFPPLQISFLHLLRLASSFENSEPKDSVYALLNIPTADSHPERPILQVDYSLAKEVIYKKLVEKFLLQPAPLSFLQNARGTDYRNHVDYDDRHYYYFDNDDDDKHSPSWLPRFHQPSRACRPMLSPWAIGALFSTSQGLDFEGGMSPDLKSLDLKGIEFSTVLWVSTVLSYSWSLNWPIIADCLKLYAQNGLDVEIITKMSRTLCAGRNKFSEIEEDKTALAGCFAAAMDEGCSPQRESAPGLYDSLLEEVGRGKDARDFTEVATDVCPRHVLFLTSGGHLGLGHQNISPADSIWVLGGAHMPFAIRKVNDSYKLVGDCFMDDVMDGQVVRSMRRGTPLSSASATVDLLDRLPISNVLPPSAMSVWNHWKKCLSEGLEERYRVLRATKIALQ